MGFTRDVGFWIHTAFHAFQYFGKQNGWWGISGTHSCKPSKLFYTDDQFSVPWIDPSRSVNRMFSILLWPLNFPAEFSRGNSRGLFHRRYFSGAGAGVARTHFYVVCRRSPRRWRETPRGSPKGMRMPSLGLRFPAFIVSHHECRFQDLFCGGGVEGTHKDDFQLRPNCRHCLSIFPPLEPRCLPTYDLKSRWGLPPFLHPFRSIFFWESTLDSSSSSRSLGKAAPQFH